MKLDFNQLELKVMKNFNGGEKELHSFHRPPQGVLFHGSAIHDAMSFRE